MLDSLDLYLKDRHLHVIAPPGSGKTILGLEVTLRINKPTLIIAPTIAIRNQWIQKFCNYFLQISTVPDWISKDIYNPKLLTIITYQGLYAACNNLKAIDDDPNPESEISTLEPITSSNKNLVNIVELLREKQIGAIVLDEAHHLKNEWWQTLTLIKKSFSPIIVGLTATPPYDVTPLEWQRYTEINGPIDIEISVPELVIEGDLCPHQDYIFYALPSHLENQHIKDFRKKIQYLFEEIKNDKTIIAALVSHPIWLTPKDNLEWIYENLSYYSASLIYLNANKQFIPQSHLDIIGDVNLKIPEFNYQWAETLLEFYLFKDPINFNSFLEHRNDLEHKLLKNSAIEGGQVNLIQNRRITTILTSSISKLYAIEEIVEFEYKQLGSTLRLVVLSDYIRKEFYTKTSVNDLELNKLGVIPIFEHLRRKNNSQIKIGVLTGSLVIIPKAAYAAFENISKRYSIKNIKCSPVLFDNNYILIETNEQLKNDVVHLITDIFQQGEIEVLIGTKSLLGEGWDAPVINTLVLASFVGSFVSSNQMRGRAIRTHFGNRDKTGNIWHLACADPTSATGGEDINLLKRRFKSFVGISSQQDSGIENGARRLNIPEHFKSNEDVDQKNSSTMRFAADRQSLKIHWKQAIEKGVSLIEEIKIPFIEKRPFQELKQLYLRKTIANLLATLAFGLYQFFEILLRAVLKMKSANDLYSLVKILSVMGVIFYGRLAFKTLILYIKYRDISKDVQKIGEALLSSLVITKNIQGDPSNLSVMSSINDDGTVICHLDGGTSFENNLFINALEEILAPIENPKYFIVRKGILMRLLKQRDFHAVPEVLSRNKDAAMFFKEEWERVVGSCTLFSARTIPGRKMLLKSRIHSLASQFEDKIERVNKWRY